MKMYSLLFLFHTTNDFILNRHGLGNSILESLIYTVNLFLILPYQGTYFLSISLNICSY